MMPVSETHPLSMCSHFVAGAPMVLDGNEGGPGLQGFYSSKGLAILGTVMDGDCGIDVACQMLCLPQTFAQRAALREEISDYLLARVNKPWMQEVMGILQEVNLDDVRQILREPADAKWGGTPQWRWQREIPNPPQWRWQSRWQTRTPQRRWH